MPKPKLRCWNQNEPVKVFTGQGVQWDRNCSCIFAGPKTGPLLDRIDGMDSSFPVNGRPIRTGTVWKLIRVHKA